MRLLICILLAGLVQSCNNVNEQQEPFKSLLQNCDTVNFNFYNAGDTVHFNTADSLGIKYLTQAVSGDSETVSDTCKPVGELYYRAKGDTLLRAEFALIPGRKREECAYLAYAYQNKSYKNRLPEKIYQLLTQMNIAVDSTRRLNDSLQKIEDSINAALDSLHTN